MNNPLIPEEIKPLLKRENVMRRRRNILISILALGFLFTVIDAKVVYDRKKPIFMFKMVNTAKKVTYRGLLSNVTYRYEEVNDQRFTDITFYVIGISVYSLGYSD